MPALTPDEIACVTELLPLWRVEAGAVSRTLIFKDAKTAIGFIIDVSVEALALGTAPDWLTNAGVVTVRLATPDVGEITAVDLQLLRAIDAAAVRRADRMVQLQA